MFYECFSSKSVSENDLTKTLFFEFLCVGYIEGCLSKGYSDPEYIRDTLVRCYALPYFDPIREELNDEWFKDHLDSEVPCIEGYIRDKWVRSNTRTRIEFDSDAFRECMKNRIQTRRDFERFRRFLESREGGTGGAASGETGMPPGQV
jgi:hypothetical protein